MELSRPYGRAGQCASAPGRPRPLSGRVLSLASSGRAWHRVHSSLPRRVDHRLCSPTPPRAALGDDNDTLPPPFADLPIGPHLPSVAARLRPDGAVLVLEAAPGAGKTTALPLAMAEALGGRGGGVVMVVEPRRLAARAAARRMAALLGEPCPGRTVGFRVRGAVAVSAATVVEVVTPGVALRALAGAAARACEGEGGGGGREGGGERDTRAVPLGRYAAVMVDEVHERGVETDACLALLAAGGPLRAARPDLRVVAASATLGGGLAEKVAALLAGREAAKTIVTLPEGRAFPVRTVYAGPPASLSDRDLAAAVVGGLKAGWALVPGADALVFLPGAREIRAVTAALSSASAGLTILPLHGSLPVADQDAALRPPLTSSSSPPSTRVILATPVAESSLTVPGIRLVVDAGLARTPSADAASGMDRLVTTPISQASADQRRGRAGRTAPGVCVRLWTEASHARRPPAGRPAIERADLSGVALILASAGLGRGLEALPWLDGPPPDAVRRAGALLRRLWAAKEGEEGTEGLTLMPLGAASARLGAHPRLGRALLVAADLGVPALGAVLAGLVSAGRDVFFPPSARRPAHGLGADIRPRLLALAGAGPGVAALDGRAARAVLDDALVLHGQLRRVVLAAARGEGGGDDDDDSGGGLASSDEEEEEEEKSDEGDAPATTTSTTALPRYGRGPAARATLAADAASQLLSSPPSTLGALIAAAYPDRVAVRRARANRGRDASFVVGGGGGSESASASSSARLPDPGDPLQAAPFLAIATLASSSGAGKSPVILAATALDADGPAVRAVQGLVAVRERAAWTPGPARRLACVRVTAVGDAVAAEEEVDPASLPVAVLEGAAVELATAGGLAAAGAPAAVLATRARAAWAAAALNPPDWPDLSEPHLARTLPAWLPRLASARTAADLAALPWEAGLRALLSEGQWATVDAAAPAEWQVSGAGGSVALALDYSPPTGPVALLPLDLAFEASLAAGGPSPPAVGVRLVLPGGGAPLAEAASLEGLWKHWPRVRAALRRRPGGGKGQDWPEAAPGRGGGGGQPAAGAGKKGKGKKR